MIPDHPRVDAGTPHRYSSLDGLRGLAALVVLVCHVLLIQPVLMQAYYEPLAIPAGTGAWWTVFSPVHLAWAGTEAVYLFFVLSGFVLALPFERTGRLLPPGYYPKRFLRLYLPVWAAFVLAVFWMTVLPRHFGAQDSVWLQGHVPFLSEQIIVSDLFLFPFPGSTNSALWSLRYEVAFSVLLPLFLVAGRALPRLNLAKFVLLMGAIVYFSYSSEIEGWGFYMPMFGLGTLMALERTRLVEWGRRIRQGPYPSAILASLSVLALLLLNSYWTSWTVTSDTAALQYLLPAARGLSVLGACLAVWLVIQGAWSVLERPAMQWLGKRSFSLYLVHEPVVVSTALLLGGRPSVIVSLAVAVPTSLLLAEGFYRAVEKPSHHLSRGVGDWLESRRLGSATAVPQEALR